jgi:hypothetical protein
MKTKHLLIVCALSLLIGFVTGLFIAPRPKIETGTTYEPLPPVEVSRDSSELRPISSTKPDSIVYVTVYVDRPAIVDSGPPPMIDTLASYRATVEDWNIRREYADTLIHSDTLGVATYRANVQYNKLIGFDFRYTPVQQATISIMQSPTRIQPYMLGNITTKGSSAGIGLKYGKIGAHFIAGYEHSAAKMYAGAGVLFEF